MGFQVFFNKARLIVTFSDLNTGEWGHRVYEIDNHAFLQGEEIKNKRRIWVLLVVEGFRSAQSPNSVNVRFASDLGQASVWRRLQSDCSLHQCHSVGLIFKYQVIFYN